MEAVELPGHGRSGWFADGLYSTTRLAVVLLQTIEAIGWCGPSPRAPATPADAITMLAHSQGTAYATMAVSAFPEWFANFVCLEGFGGFGLRYGRVRTTAVQFDEPSRALRLSYESLAAINARAKQHRPPKVYTDLEHAAETMVKVVDAMVPPPLRMWISSARAILSRATAPAPAPAPSGGSAPLIITHDTRINVGTVLQLFAFPELIEMHSQLPPTLVLLADRGYPNIIEVAQDLHRRLPSEVQRTITISVFGDGSSHHVRLDEPARVAEHVLAFLADGTRPSGPHLPRPATVSRL